MENGRRGRDLRVGDPERERAMQLLGEHFTAGRLDVQEYDERCQRAAAARIRSELDALFRDLPEPHPATPPIPVKPSVPAAKVVFAVCAVALAVVLLLAARQFGLLLLLPLLVVFWFSWRR
ncbi:hypothetical protein GCM10011581_13080 [Saccharopolyspora subtropica]|uniref:DUF1707 domain-containing protein n=1 Tax=Saccharopolyspora thermophila TaxID=89367 RepID=A0A917JQV2_9PSEU|nr:DUF1707 domain-containing protein [Saccharopolyspora subtropica]GGI77395.1 hypothetical protein GCM10011581_13080 [Saccharopolyspora subtropica]